MAIAVSRGGKGHGYVHYKQMNSGERSAFVCSGLRRRPCASISLITKAADFDMPVSEEICSCLVSLSVPEFGESARRSLRHMRKVHK